MRGGAILLMFSTQLLHIMKVKGPKLNKKCNGKLTQQQQLLVKKDPIKQK